MLSNTLTYPCKVLSCIFLRDKYAHNIIIGGARDKINHANVIFWE